MFTRRSFLITTAGSLLAAANIHSAYAEQPPPTQVTRMEPVDEKDLKGTVLGKFPGDYGFGHHPYHPLYEKVFGEILKCACGDGECRITDWRSTRLGSPVGYDVIVLRQWCALPAGVRMPTKEQTPKALRLERAHVCSYGTVGNMYIPCVIINEAKA